VYIAISYLTTPKDHFILNSAQNSKKIWRCMCTQNLRRNTQTAPDFLGVQIRTRQNFPLWPTQIKPRTRVQISGHVKIVKWKFNTLGQLPAAIIPLMKTLDVNAQYLDSRNDICNAHRKWRIACTMHICTYGKYHTYYAIRMANNNKNIAQLHTATSLVLLSCVAWDVIL